ncbi:hypothetical protein KAW08_01960 [bacterium]|nr:hypothetical protein [bacterium]
MKTQFLKVKTNLPNELFNMDEIYDPKGLDIVIQHDDIVTCKEYPRQELRQIELEFTSQITEGEVWRHRCLLFLPYPSVPEDRCDKAAIMTQRHSADKNAPLIIEHEYGKVTAAMFKIPVLIIGDSPGGRFGSKKPLDEVFFNKYCLNKMIETGNVSWFGHYRIARYIMRAITLLASFENKIKHVVLCGSSKRASGCFLAGACDSRVQGIMHCGLDCGNLQKYFERINRGDYAPHAENTAFSKLFERIKNYPNMEKILQHFDFSKFCNKIPSILLMAGTRDRLYFPMFSLNDFYNVLPKDKGIEFINDCPHCCTHIKHIINWRMWIAHCFFGRKIPKVEIILAEHISKDSFLVKCKLLNNTQILKVTLYFTIEQPTEKTIWQDISMQKEGKNYMTRIKLKENKEPFYFVEVEHVDQGIPGFVSSLPHGPGERI